jgi:hypothetical protein
VGGVAKEPRDDVKAIAVMSAPPELCTVTDGAEPFVIFNPTPLLVRPVMYGELQEFQDDAPFPESTWMTASVPLNVRFGPEQVVQVEEVVVPAVSNEAVEPEGGRISMKFPPRYDPAAAVKLTVTVVAPAAPSNA